MRHARLSIASLVLFGLALGAFAQHSAIDPQPRDSDWWAKRHASMNARVAEGHADLIFVGDSITQGWEGAGKEIWAEYYAHRNAVNLGISGDRTEHVLWRLENGNIEGISPRAGVVMIGTNNWEQNSAQEISEGITQIVEKLQTEIPGIKILLLAIFPRADKPQEIRDKLIAVNKTVSGLADWQDVFYLDLAHDFLDGDGTLPQTVMPDHLHPNKAGYQRWAEAMEPILANLLGDMPRDGIPWKPLFDGESLEGWQVIEGAPDAWTAEDNVLYTTADGSGWLSTQAEYACFELLLEFAVPPGGNSGVFVRAPREGTPWTDGFEVQVLDDYAEAHRALQPAQFCGSIYAVVAPSERVSRPAGEWQQLRIRAEGPEVRVWLNGTRIVDADLSQFSAMFESHPGLAREAGFIGLQNHGSRLDYRDLEIRVLK